MLLEFTWLGTCCAGPDPYLALLRMAHDADCSQAMHVAVSMRGSIAMTHPWFLLTSPGPVGHGAMLACWCLLWLEPVCRFEPHRKPWEQWSLAVANTAGENAWQGGGLSPVSLGRGHSRGFCCVACEGPGERAQQGFLLGSM